MVYGVIIWERAGQDKVWTPGWHAHHVVWHLWSSYAEWHDVAESRLIIWCWSMHLSHAQESFYTMTHSCPHHDTVTTKTVELLHAVRSITVPSTSIDTWPSYSTWQDKTRLIWEQNNPPSGTCPSHPLLPSVQTPRRLT